MNTLGLLVLQRKLKSGSSLGDLVTVNSDYFYGKYTSCTSFFGKSMVYLYTSLALVFVLVVKNY